MGNPDPERAAIQSVEREDEARYIASQVRAGVQAAQTAGVRVVPGPINVTVTRADGETVEVIV